MPTGQAYVEGNLTEENNDLDAIGTETMPFPAPAVDTQDACAAASLVLGSAGVSPRDSIDEGI